MVEKVEPATATYDVCLSFAGEQRHYVAEVARALKDAGVAVFYDAYETVAMWGHDASTHLSRVYGRTSRYCVVFVSSDYARKAWPHHELRAAFERALLSRSDYLLPVRFDDTEIPGLLETTSYVEIQRTSPVELARMIEQKLTLPPDTARPATTVSVVMLAGYSAHED